MRLVGNYGTDRVIDLVQGSLDDGAYLALATPHLSVFGYRALQEHLRALRGCRLALPSTDPTTIELLGAPADRAARNQLEVRWLANQLAQWLDTKVELKEVGGAIPQSAIVLSQNDKPLLALTGHCHFSSEGLGLLPNPPSAMVQASESPGEAQAIAGWLQRLWTSLPNDRAVKARLRAFLEEIVAPHRHRWSTTASSVRSSRAKGRTSMKTASSAAVLASGTARSGGCSTASSGTESSEL